MLVTRRSDQAIEPDADGLAAVAPEPRGAPVTVARSLKAIFAYLAADARAAGLEGTANALDLVLLVVEQEANELGHLN